MKEEYFHEKLLEKAFGFQFLEWHAVCKNLLRMTQPDLSICDLKTLFGFNLISTPKKPAKETEFSLLTKTYSHYFLWIYAKAEHKNVEWIEFHSCRAYLLKGGRSTSVVSNYANQLATHGSDLSVLLWFVQFVKLSFRLYSHTVIDHNFFVFYSLMLLFIYWVGKWI